MRSPTFEERLRILHDVGNELSRAKSVDDLCRSVVEAARNRLGFDRLSIWFVDADPDYLKGSFGVNENGDIREELGNRILIDSDPITKELREKRLHSVYYPDLPLRDQGGKVVGHGPHITAAIWNGEEVIGYIFTDNFLKKEPLTERDAEILELFASTFGHLYSLKKAEEELKGMQDQLIQTAKMKVVGSLASGVAHEVKNPLAIIQQGIDYVSEKVQKKDENVRLTLQRMRGAIKRADDIIKGLLDFSAMAKLEHRPENLNVIADQALLLVKHEIDRAGIDVLEDFEEDLPWIRLDKNKIEQVFVNIFLNAVHHMKEGGKLTLRTRLKNSAEGDDVILVEIEDTGTGIPANIIDKIFDPFFTTRRGEGGTGLGLSIARSIIEMHNAKIDIGNREDGHGAKVTLTFKA